MRKKIFIGLLAAAVVALLYVAADIYITVRNHADRRRTEQMYQPETKTIYLTFVDKINGVTLIDNQAFSTQRVTLGGFLEEDHPEFVIILSKWGEQGRAIVAFNINDHGYVSDFASTTGPWIMYSSDNNESCVANGFCLGIDNFHIADGDRFVFEYTDVSIFD